MNNDRKSKNKVRGFKGHIRDNLIIIPIMFYTLVNFLIGMAGSILTYIALGKLGEGTVIAQISSFLAFLVTVILYNWVGSIIIIKNDGYYMRPMTTKEYAVYSEYNLIHYTDYLAPADVDVWRETGNIRLIGNGSAEANYTMHAEDRESKFVWFHISKEPQADEPVFDSFWYSHKTESTPRDYKIVVPLGVFRPEQLYIRKLDNAVAIKGDYEGKCFLATNFNWYNDRVYWMKSISMSYRQSLLLSHAAVLQIKGKWLDRKSQIKRKK